MSNEVEIYSNGLVTCSVCAPKDMSIEDVTREVNLQNPTGISSRWELSEETTWFGGNPHPCSCEQDENRVHYLFNC